MNLFQLKKIARGTRVLSQIIGRQKLSAWSGAGVGLEIVNFTLSNQKEKILVLAPHPDDDVFGCGGTIALHASNNDDVTVVYLTNGIHGTPEGKKNPALVDIRRHEATHALEKLGKITSEFWEYDDGSLAADDAKIKKLTDLIDKFQPTRIYLPWYGESNQDHQAAFNIFVKTLKQLSDCHSRSSRESFKSAKFYLSQDPRAMAGASPRMTIAEIWQYEVWSPLVPNRIVPIEKVLEQKRAAIAAHESQMNSRLYTEGILGLNNYRGAMNDLAGPAEAFFALPTKEFLDFTKTILELPY